MSEQGQGGGYPLPLLPLPPPLLPPPPIGGGGGYPLPLLPLPPPLLPPPPPPIGGIQPRRYTQKKIELSDGHFVYDCPVPTGLTTKVPFREKVVYDCPVPTGLTTEGPKRANEFDEARYTACTCDPDDFEREKYTLRQKTYKRDTEIFIVITMYDEDAKLFARTFHGVVENIRELCKRDRSDTWKEDGWKKVVVCIVSDGFEEINISTKAYLSAIGVYQEGVVKKEVNNKPVTAHIFEYTTHFCLDPENMKPVEVYTPIQVLFCLKEENTKKINSHRWFFNAFGKILKPNVCILLDAGTKPGEKSIYHLWKAFDNNSSIGGACGEIVAMKGKYGKNILFNPLVAAQNFEYKMSNILDKPLESVFGYITVLPGAFSAYRYKAIANQIDPETNEEVGPLASYFLGEKLHNQKLNDQKIKTGLFEANMYLAEDRILCFELISKRDESWLLRYVKSASAETDVPDKIIDLIKQRRRWLNGTFFASLYAISHTFNIYRSKHSISRKILLSIEMFYQTYNLIFSWFALGNLYLIFYILGNSVAQYANWELILYSGLKFIYIALIVFQVALAMGNKPGSTKLAYIFSTLFFASIMIHMLVATGWITYISIKDSQVKIDGLNLKSVQNILSDFNFRNIVLSLLSTYGLYLIISVLSFEPYHMISSFPQYMLLVPFYVNVLNIYAFCNIHDVSWGTKGEPKKKKVHDEKEKVDTKGDQSATVDVPEDADEEYEKVQSILMDPKTHDLGELKERQEEAQKESNAKFRTYLVSSWIFSNMLLIFLITNLTSTSSSNNIYFIFILWSVAILAAIRFIGSCIYLILRLFTEKIFDKFNKARKDVI
ncbi:Glycosyltransferase Family 2 protein [Rhizophagus diaphanus]|nr:Glycosyltransferase Family 2 protein [Rhizophagus diaphanus] [Rhizophagus sp. MUCL 43196]